MLILQKLNFLLGTSSSFYLAWSDSSPGEGNNMSRENLRPL